MATPDFHIPDRDRAPSQQHQQPPTLTPPPAPTLPLPPSQALAGSIPALHLYPLNDSFVPKQIYLGQGRVKIGRQTNQKTVPGERNGFFDSKVLSRMHAEVWEEGGKVLIKDVKSSNGTFINAERLSPEGVESEPFELKSEDVVEFGIDIVGEDNKTIVHHKVAAKVFCVLSPEDLNASLSSGQLAYHRNGAPRPAHPSIGASPQQQQQGQQQQVNGIQQGQGSQQGAGQQQQPGAPGAALGGMGGARAPGKSGLTFDHLLSRLQGELNKSRETGHELGGLGREVGEIGETLSGGMPTHVHLQAHGVLQPVRSGSGAGAGSAAASGGGSAGGNGNGNGNVNGSESALSTLESQLSETRASLETHADKVRSLESLVMEHDALKREVMAMREVMEESRRMVEGLRREREREEGGGRGDERGEEREGEEDDARSVLTVVPEEEERREEQEEQERQRDHEQEMEDAERREEVDRPGTPEPTGHGLDEDDVHEHEHEHDAPLVSPPISPPRQQITINGINGHHSSPPLADPPNDPDPSHDFLTRTEHTTSLAPLLTQLSALSAQLTTALSLSSSLSAQQDAVRALEKRLEGWESWRGAVDEERGVWEGRVGELARVVEGLRGRGRREEEEVDSDEASSEGDGEDVDLDVPHPAEADSPPEDDSAPPPPRQRRRRRAKAPRQPASSSSFLNGHALPAAHELPFANLLRPSSPPHSHSPPSEGESSASSSGKTKVSSSSRARSGSLSTAVGSEFTNPSPTDNTKSLPAPTVPGKDEGDVRTAGQVSPHQSPSIPIPVLLTGASIVVVAVAVFAYVNRIKD